MTLFQKFTQADASTTRKYGGTGLGLAISKQLVELMGGSIGLASKEGAGSQFYFDLPLTPTHAVIAAAVAAPPHRNFTGARVLIAEDNAVNQKLLCRMLERRGCVADVVSNGKEAVEFALARNYALILMDCQMPVMDGFEATRRVQAVLGESAPPIIAVTARAMKQDREVCLQAGMVDHLVKPLSGASVDAMLEKWLSPLTVPDTSPLIFEAVVSREAAQRRLLDELLSLFGGRSQPILAHLIESGTLTLEDVRDAEKTLLKVAGEEKQRNSNVVALC
jgi:CheY-like chemotaxis protein